MGSNNPRWIKDRKQARQDRRNDGEYKQWRFSVYKRDGFICKFNNQDCKGRLESHHILSWKEYPELRYDINNGITLCHSHHPFKKVDGEKLISFFHKLIGVNE